MLDVILHGLKGARCRERELFKEAIRLAKDAINSKLFKEMVLAAEFIETKGDSNQEIYDKIMSGKDKYEREDDNTIDLHINIYKSFKRTVAYTRGSTYFIWFNRKYLGLNRDPARVANTLLHEYCHNLGYGHRSKHQRKLTVPYQMGRILQRCIEIKRQLDIKDHGGK